MGGIRKVTSVRHEGGEIFRAKKEFNLRSAGGREQKPNLGLVSTGTPLLMTTNFTESDAVAMGIAMLPSLRRCLFDLLKEGSIWRVVCLQTKKFLHFACHHVPVALSGVIYQ